MGRRVNEMRTKKRNAKRQSRKTRQLQFERLETRRVLAGVVDVFTDPVPGGVPAVVPGELLLVGDANGNHVQITEVAGEVNSFTISSGDGNTLFRHNGGAPVPSLPVVRGISGPMNIQLDAGNDIFELLGTDATNLIRVQGDLTITNAEGNNTNRLSLVELLGATGLTIDRPLGGVISNSTLEIIDSLIDNDVTVSNDFDGGGGPSVTLIESTNTASLTTWIGGDVVIDNDLGQTDTDIVDSRINGLLSIDNDTGGTGEVEDIIDIQGTSIGAGLFDTPAGGPPTSPIVVTINNGAGGSRTTFTRGREAGAPTGAGRVTVYGGVSIANGDTIDGKFDFVMFNLTDVLGGVAVTNFDGESRTTVTNSKIGMDFASAPGLIAPPVLPPGFGIGYGGPFIMINGNGRDDVDIVNLESQYGVSIDNGDPGQVFGGDVDITGSSLGNHPFGPNLGAGVGLPDVGLHITGDDAEDLIDITDTSVGGGFDLSSLAEGHNIVTLENFDMQSGVLEFNGGMGRNELYVLSSGAGRSVLAGLEFLGGDNRDRARLTDTTILVYLNIDLGDGADTLELRGSTLLPPTVLLALPFVLEGGAGADELGVDAGILIPFPTTGFEIPLP